jgi:hypothetical protein
MLVEGGAHVTERGPRGVTAVYLAALYGRWPLLQWLLEIGGACIEETTDAGTSVWDALRGSLVHLSLAEVTSLLLFMVVRGTPSAGLVAALRPEHAQLVREGYRIQTRLPAYLVQRRALLDAHCPLISPLRALVHDYDPEPTTTEELWATGLGVAT